MALIIFDTPVLYKVISGGQVGADQGGLEAAYDCGFRTGGFAPRGFRTLFGNNPQILKDRFKLEEINSIYYADRTKKNVEYSDATIRFASNFGTAGEKCTLKFIQRFNRPYFDVDLNKILLLEDDGEEYIKERKEEFIRFLIDHQVGVLNVAGNADRLKNGGRGMFHLLTYQFLVDILKRIKI